MSAALPVVMIEESLLGGGWRITVYRDGRKLAREVTRERFEDEPEVFQQMTDAMLAELASGGGEDG